MYLYLFQRANLLYCASATGPIFFKAARKVRLIDLLCFFVPIYSSSLLFIIYIGLSRFAWIMIIVSDPIFHYFRIARNIVNFYCSIRISF